MKPYTGMDIAMKNSNLFCAISAVFLLTGVASADTFSGTQCNVNSSNPNAGYNLFGIHNLSTNSAMSVDCSAVIGAPVHSVSFTGYDRSPTDDVRCQVALLNSAGQIVFSANVSTTGFSAGPMTATASVPGISAGLVLECSIPAFNAQNGASHITTYTVQ
jgi:hypothetical protein